MWRPAFCLPGKGVVMNYQPYPIRLRPDERAMLREVARRLKRSQADTVRVLVRGAFQVLEEEHQESLPKQPRKAQPFPA